MVNQSTVKIPDSVSRDNNIDLVDTILWSGELDDTFRSIRERDPDIRLDITLSDIYCISGILYIRIYILFFRVDGS